MIGFEQSRHWVRLLRRFHDTRVNRKSLSILGIEMDFLHSRYAIEIETDPSPANTGGEQSLRHAYNLFTP